MGLDGTNRTYRTDMSYWSHLPIVSQAWGSVALTPGWTIGAFR
ncbi:hypothetical protein Pla52n_18910 [Stieleria varia]|uniref:Uncharacterized protein n=1 Tax=Stieleria varia TaxID=2528005 RepID=A0A5C6B3W2_9BACT|nr:hypothetical protein Pla52n_18910 [Stieleria varia]